MEEYCDVRSQNKKSHTILVALSALIWPFNHLLSSNISNDQVLDLKGGLGAEWFPSKKPKAKKTQALVCWAKPTGSKPTESTKKEKGQCDECGKFLLADSLKDHRQGRETYRCMSEECNHLQFCTRTLLKNHTNETGHTGYFGSNKEDKCEGCGGRISLRTLREHLQGLKLNKCCGKAFCTIPSLQQHKAKYNCQPRQQIPKKRKAPVEAESRSQAKGTLESRSVSKKLLVIDSEKLDQEWEAERIKLQAECLKGAKFLTCPLGCSQEKIFTKELLEEHLRKYHSDSVLSATIVPSQAFTKKKLEGLTLHF